MERVKTLIEQKNYALIWVKSWYEIKKMSKEWNKKIGTNLCVMQESDILILDELPVTRPTYAE